jgi:PKD repeat protein
VKHIPVYWQTCVYAVLIAVLVVPVASATTIVMPTDDQLIVKSPVIVEGTVVSSVPVQIGTRIWTETQVNVGRSIKGDASGTITIREIGGVLGDQFTKIFGAPEYSVGERVLLFLTPTPRGDYQTTDLFLGKFTADQTLDGRAMWIRHDETADAVLLDSDFHPIHAGNIQRDASRFEQFVIDRVGGRAGAKNYGVENPMLRSVIHDGGGERLKPSANFTLLDEPTIYRWFNFDSGSSAGWYSYGTQPGYTGGGVNEIKTAMNAWTSYSAATIKYTYIGSETTGAGMNTNNGRNEVLFNDPFADISGSWNPSTGGVVGLGGINGVSGTGSFTAGFTYDAAHTAGVHSNVYKISEANLTIQDNVSSSTGIPSTTLAEIVAHEFGHTLGFGHSTDGTALMYPSVTGLGPSLRADDQTAARWLYGNGSSTPPAGTAPNAPSNLTATQSGSANVVLHWNDNAADETAEQVYVALGTGSFSKVTDLAANTTSVTLTGFSTGTYKFYITASNAYGTSAASNQATTTFTTTVPATPPVSPAFGFSPSNPVTAQVISFNDTSSGSPTSWHWDFGDTVTSTSQNPVHAYAYPGTYTVSLTVSNAVSSAATTHQIVVTQAQLTTRALVSAAAQTNGQGGSVWRTELTLFNAGSDMLTVNLIFIPSSGNAVQSRGIALGAKQSVTYANALVDLYGIQSGAGAIAIEATSVSSTPQLRVTSRTFTDGVIGTYGQAVPSVGSSDFSGSLYLTGMATNASYRTNIGLVNRGGSNATATLALYDTNGAFVASANVSVPANNFQQSGITQYFPSIASRSYDALSMRVTSNAPDAISVYASVIDNRTQDPVYIQATPGGGSSPMVLPAVGHLPGVGGTYWRSDVTIYNPSSSTMNIGMRYFAAGNDNSNATTRNVSVAAGRTVVLADVLQQFGISNGSGALELSWPNGISPIVTSRTYTTASNGGTYGQSIDPVAAFGSDMYVVGLRSDVSFRSNVGFVNDGSQPISVSLTLIASSGAPIATGFITMPPKSQSQYALSSIFPNLTVANLGGVTLQAHSDSGTLFAYGSMIDNASGDPVFFAGQ